MRDRSIVYVLLIVSILAAGTAEAASVALPSAGPLSPATAIALLGWAGLACALGLSYALFGAIKVKDTNYIAQKYVTRAGAASKDYSDGVASAGNDWMANSKAAEASWEQGTQQAIADKRYQVGIDGKAGKYVANATKLGAQRYVPGVQNAQQAYATGFGPYAEKLKSLSLPPRGPRRSPQNQQRTNMVGVELGKLKVGH